MIRANWTKGLALLLALLLVMLPLAACGQGEPEEEVKMIAGIGSHEVIFELDDMPLLWEEMYYYLQHARHMLERAMPVEDWDAYSNESNADGDLMTYNELLIYTAIMSALQHRAVEWLFNDLGETLDENYYQETKAEYMEAFEMNEEEFLEMLWENYMTEDVFMYVFSILAMRDQAILALYGEHGENVPAETVNAFVEEHEILRAKHILLMTQGLTEEEQDEVRAAADAIFEEVTALQGNARMIRFEELIAEEGEDPGMDSNPEGYVFMEGVMVPEFFDGTMALAYGEISPPIRSNFGYHIILRLPVEGDQFVMLPGGAQPMLIQSLAAGTHMESLLETIKEELQEQYRTTPLFDRIVPSEIFAAAE
ncbi:MAG: peptidylprolyl isomerase [Oscillospiraceae bacterium]|nr:peptidylprolyl isomerase [Oscillospiraceae bacterium]